MAFCGLGKFSRKRYQIMRALDLVQKPTAAAHDSVVFKMRLSGFFSLSECMNVGWQTRPASVRFKQTFYFMLG